MLYQLTWRNDASLLVDEIGEQAVFERRQRHRNAVAKYLHMPRVEAELAGLHEEIDAAFRPGHAALKADHVVRRARFVFFAQLNHREGPAPRARMLDSAVSCTNQSTLFCTEYCGGGGDGQQGSGHSAMWTRVHVLSDSDFDKWMQSQEDDPNAPPAEKGKKLFVTRGCAGCHSVDGARGNGPTLKGVFGKTEQMSTGEAVPVDENYLHESILQSQKRLVAGFGGIMPAFEGQLSEKEVTYLVEYIKTLK